MLDVSSQSPSWVPTVDMLVGGKNGANVLNTVEVFDTSNQKWKMVGGADGKCALKSVEYYDPTLDTWTPVAEMSVSRQGVGVGVLDGLMYGIGNYNGKDLKSVEVYIPSDGVWSSVADMHFSRIWPVAALDGLLYVMGGEESESVVDTVEIYNPITNTWTLEPFSRNEERVYGGVVIDKPPYYT
ncbi:hypothetical protein QTP88_028105 [Uroleucon formosanum]